MSSLEFKNIKELKALGRQRIIELAKEAAREAGSRMVPDDDKEIKVLVSDKEVKVVVAKGFRAYSDGTARVITSMSVLVDYQDVYPSITWEGKDRLNDQDKKIIELVLKTMPTNYKYLDITITNDPAQDTENYLVSLDGHDGTGSHAVNKMSGEWKYISHKHYARGHDAEDREFKEL